MTLNIIATHRIVIIKSMEIIAGLYIETITKSIETSESNPAPPVKNIQTDEDFLS